MGVAKPYLNFNKKIHGSGRGEAVSTLEKLKIMTNSNGWHVVYVRSRHEKKVHHALQEIAIDSFLPMTTTIRKWSDRTKKILKPLFPSYVFVNIKSSMDFHKTLSVEGACAYISFGNEYAKVKEKEINQIKYLVGSKDITDIEQTNTLPQVGTIKKISYGPLNGMECEVIKVNNANKIVVRIQSLQQNITATLPPNFITN